MLLPDEDTVISMLVIPAATSFHLSTIWAVVRVRSFFKVAVIEALEPPPDIIFAVPMETE